MELSDLSKHSLALASRALLPRTTDRRRLSRVLSTHGRAASATARRPSRRRCRAIQSPCTAASYKTVQLSAVHMAVCPHVQSEFIRAAVSLAACRTEGRGSCLVRRSSIIRLVTLFLQINNGKHASPREYQINWLRTPATHRKYKANVQQQTRFTTVRASTAASTHV